LQRFDCLKITHKKRIRAEEKFKEDQQREEEEKRQLEEELKQPWVPLEDQGMDEKEIEPDFYVDRPPTPEYIPNPAGLEKETQVEDHELFDFELEVEPILEVLVGKAIEQGRIEALEEWEQEELRKHKEQYNDIREAELMEVQRLEAAYNRRVEESRRRKLQQEAHTALRIQTQQKLLARLISRGLLSNLKKNSIQMLEDAGVLRDPTIQDLHSVYIPHLLGVAEEHISEQVSQTDLLSEMLEGAIAMLNVEHRDGIIDEYKRRLSKKQKDEEDRAKSWSDKLTRHEEREKLREQKRLDELKLKIEDQIVSKSTQIEDPLTVRITDVILEDKEKHLFTIGGIMGEIILTITKVVEMLTAATPEFKMTQEIIDAAVKEICDTFLKTESFIDICLMHEFNFAEAVAKNEQDKIKAALSPENNASYGLQYLLERSAKFGINNDLSYSIMMGFIAFKSKPLQEQKQLLTELVVDEEKIKDLPEEEKAKEKDRVNKENEEIKKQNAEIKIKNEEIEKENAVISQLQGKIRIISNQEKIANGSLCAVARIGPIMGPPTPKSSLPGHTSENQDLNNSKKVQKQPVSTTISKHQVIGNIVDDLRVAIINKGIFTNIAMFLYRNSTTNKKNYYWSNKESSTWIGCPAARRNM